MNTKLLTILEKTIESAIIYRYLLNDNQINLIKSQQFMRSTYYGMIRAANYYILN